MPGSLLPRNMTPAVGEQNTANVQKDRFYIRNINVGHLSNFVFISDFQYPQSIAAINTAGLMAIMQ
jgi:hypothetical protein